MMCVGARANEIKQQADSAYAQEQYAEAATLYLSLVSDSAQSAYIYYNVGNCYYRMDSIAQAILYYERARLLNPADKDILTNLEMARLKTVDKVAPASEMVVVTFFRTLMLQMTVQGWAILGVVMFVLMLVALLGYFFLPSVAGRKVGFGVAVAALVVCLFANVSAFQLRHNIRNRTGAVVMSASAVVKSTPNHAGVDLFILHEGTTVQVVDDTMHDWVEIHMTDGKEGWIPRADVEKI